MNHGVVFVLASSVLLGAVAAAHLMTPLPDGGPLQASAKAATVTETVSSTSRPVVEPATKPLVEVRRAPVPLQIRERPPMVLSPAVENASATAPTGPVPADAESGTFARSAIEADGYKSVRNIVPGPDGRWRARAFRGKTEVMLTVDSEGRVSAD